MDDKEVDTKRILAHFKNEEGTLVGTPFDLPCDVSPESLGLLCNAVLENVSLDRDNPCNLIVAYAVLTTNYCLFTCN